MTRLFTEDGRWIDVTVIETGPCLVVQRKTKDHDGYDAVQLGFGEIKETRLRKPQKGHFEKLGVAPKRTLREFRIDESSGLKSGDEIRADIFAAGDRVDVSGSSKGKGYQGVVKRHHQSGGPGSHGSHFHRRPGSIGQKRRPLKGFSRTRHAGPHGRPPAPLSKTSKVVSVDPEKNIITVRGANSRRQWRPHSSAQEH